MNMTPAVVQDYATRPPAVKNDTRNFRERLRDTHNESVTGGLQGPAILLIAFVSSTLTLIYQGMRYIYRRIHG